MPDTDGKRMTGAKIKLLKKELIALDNYRLMDSFIVKSMNYLR